MQLPIIISPPPSLFLRKKAVDPNVSMIYLDGKIGIDADSDGFTSLSTRLRRNTCS